jgi:hypothetical protein
VVEQARNNPGYDLLVGNGLHYCEVKGTSQPSPAFSMSEGERLFATNNAARYTLTVVYAIDLGRKIHLVAQHDGALDTAEVVLNPFQWAGEIRTSPARYE